MAPPRDCGSWGCCRPASARNARADGQHTLDGAKGAHADVLGDVDDVARLLQRSQGVFQGDLIHVWAAHAAQPQHFGFDQLLEEQGGFHLLAEEAGEELVLGFIGRWWDRGYGRVEWSAEEFRDFSRPGYAVGAWGFTVLPYGSSTTVLVTDVRVRCTDDEARRSFQRYWTAVGPFVTAMGRPVLRLIRKEAERAAKSV